MARKHHKPEEIVAKLRQVEVLTGQGKSVVDAVRAMADRGILGGVSLGRLYPGEEALANGLVVAVTETVTDEDVEALARALEECLVEGTGA